jgi:hypothetical protein
MRTMRVVHAMAVVSGGLLLACGGTDPGMDGNNAGSGGGAAGSAAGRGGNSGAGTGGSPNAGTGGDPDAGEQPPPSGSYFPFATGNTWMFQVTRTDGVTTKMQTIGPLEAVGGTGPNKDLMAFRVQSDKDEGADMTISWQVEADGKIVRYREQAFRASTGELSADEYWEPYKLRVDMNEERLIAGVTWTETYTQTKLPVGGAPTTGPASDRWRVVAVDEEVTVPAGTFDALVLEKLGGSSTKRYWFVRGIGKVKETGTQTEELMSYQLSD